MTVQKAILISSFVPSNNASPVAVNYKMMRLCCDVFEQTEFLTANFPAQALADLPSHRFRLTNLVPEFTTDSSLRAVWGYLRMQSAAIRRIHALRNHAPVVLFWLSGPMILPFLYCRLAGLYTVGFLYGNSRRKAEHITLVNFLKAVLMEYMARHADAACVESPSVAHHWKIDYEREGLHTVHLYVEDAFFNAGLSYTERPPVIGICGRLAASKRILEAVQAFHQFRRSFPEYSLEIVGDGPLRKECAQLISLLGEQAHIKMLGWIDHKSLPDYYGRWRLFLSPTNYEGLPNALLEAMAAGVPPLVSPVGGVPDVVREGETGWLLSENSSAVIGKRLTALFSDISAMESISKACRFEMVQYQYARTRDAFRYFIRTLDNKGERARL
ncbi:glycosyltransferase family 4 protein [Anaerotruncus colihominis]|uniref:glycosyltransferase family 4 protein n=1 Tax=Anaerotruncus colihominis TaxID=169435 RepID=UPI00189BAEE6|nr:glycosyltransferase family 4 protein [Anaerotruncus colihominis]